MEFNLTEDFKKSIFDCAIDFSIDITETGLDSFLDSISDNEILKEIPVVKTLYSFCKIGSAIHEKNLLQKTLLFIKEFNTKINPKKLAKYKNKIENDPYFCREELERVLLILNKILDDKKAQILANLYRNYIEENIGWDDFCESTDITERMFLTDINALLKGYESTGINLGEFENYHLDRLIALGLLENSMRIGGNIILSAGDASWNDGSNNGEVEDKDVVITELGKLYCKYGLLN